MNFIVALFLKHLTEKECFWLFSALIEVILPVNYYCDLIGMKIEVEVFKLMLNGIFPKIA